jgi:phage terminase large subunit
VDYAFIDSAAAQTKWDFAQQYDIACTNAKKSVNDGIGFVASLIDNNKLIVDESCRQTLRTLDQYQWDSNKALIREKPKHDSACHIADAIRYALYSYETSISGF